MSTLVKVVVELKSVLKQWRSDLVSGKSEFQFQEGATVGEMLRYLGLCHGEVGLVVVNGEVANEDRELEDGAKVELYPIFSGG